MKILYRLLALSLLSAPIAQLYADEETQGLPIERVNVNGRATPVEGATYYFVNSGGWGAPSCSAAGYAMINEHATGAKEMLSLALSAHAQGKNVSFFGNCSGTSYFVVNYMRLAN